jgi:ferredoxin-thioredoxin reductase catalytic subunit
MNKAQLLKLYEAFAEAKGVMLNPDKEHVDFIVESVLKLEKKTGFRYCPCRIRTGNKEMDKELFCPCNFIENDIWKDEGHCWCGLFVRKE